jgi:ribonuclease Z
MTSSVRILSTSSVDSSPSILLVNADGSKILVNCGEGCQRSFLEYSQRLSTVKAVCLTHLGHEAIGGLPGVILTSADSAASAAAEKIVQQQKQLTPKTTNQIEKNAVLPNLHLIGPLGTQTFIHSLRHFMRREQFQLDIHEGIVQDLNLGPRKSQKRNDYTTESFTITSIVCTIDDVVEPNTSPKHSRKRPHPEERIPKQVLSFIFTTPKVPGKFLPDKAMELGVPKGPLYGLLKSGQSVTFVDTNGEEKTVDSAQVVTPANPVVAVMVLYYPTDNVANVLFRSGKSLSVFPEEVKLELVIHICPAHLFKEYGLRYWREAEVQHIFVTTDRESGDLDGTPFQSAAIEAQTRAFICRELYLVPRVPLTKTHDIPNEDYCIARPMMEYILIPQLRRGFVQSTSLTDQAQDKQKVETFAQNSGAFAISKKILNDCRGFYHCGSGEQLLFTGTGSALPCKHRNVTGMFLRQADGRSILLDVGEGTIGSLLRAFPSGNDDDVLHSIKAVWISHPHADHHLGLLRLLKERRSTDIPIQLLAPGPIFRFLNEYSSIDPSIQNSYYAIDCQYLVHDNHELRARLNDIVGISSCQAIPVAHCAHSYAAIMDGTSFGRLVYSGDCRPSRELAKAAIGADLLIHEATFEDGMEMEAALKKHSTVGEALKVAADMKAKYVVLTHFSQRYPKIPPTPADSQYKSPIIFAFDFMKLQRSTLEVASRLTPALRLLYPDDETDSCKSQPSDAVAATAMSVPGLFAQGVLL